MLKALLLTTILVSCTVPASGLVPRRVYLDSPGGLPAFVMSPVPAGEAGNFRAEARVALDDLAERRGFSHGSWWLELVPAISTDTLRATLRWGNTDYGDMLDRRFTRLTVTLGDSMLVEKEVDGFATHSGAYNTLGIGISGSVVKVYGGSASRGALCEATLDDGFIPTCVRADGKGTGRVSLLVAEAEAAPETVAMTGWTREALESCLASTSDPIEGYWTYLDRANDPSYARPGGRYTLALVSDGAEGYDILYVDGAQTLADRWKPLMLKGRLSPGIFENHYSLEWIDAEFDPVTEDIHADISQDAILTLSFPLLKTTLRFSKMPVRH